MTPPKIRAEAGEAAIASWQADAAAASRDDVATAVRYTLQLLAEQFPGATLEVRVPPFAAVQCVEGPKHTRGTPPNVVEMSAEVWLRLASGSLSWADAVTTHQLSASGSRASLEGIVPVLDGTR